MTDWRVSAACLGADQTLFFPRDTDRGPNRFEPALTLCRRCPVTSECLEEALRNHETGVWGGTTDDQRRRLTNTPPPRPGDDHAHSEAAYAAQKRRHVPRCTGCRTAATSARTMREKRAAS